jgi:hypothetical protein
MSLVFPNTTKVKLISVSPNAEAHGDVNVPTLHLRFEVEMSNAVLALLHPQLRTWLYEEDTQETLPGVDAVSEYTALRFPELAAPFAWREEVEGNNLVIDYGLGGGSDIELTDCKLHKQVFEAKKGGTCKVSFTLSCAHDLSPLVVGTLALKVRQDMHIRLTAPLTAEV